MKSELYDLKVFSHKSQELILLTDMINIKILDSGIISGIGVIFSPHSTSGITINSYIDKNTAVDLNDEIARLVPTKLDFHHVVDTPSDASGHIKSSLIGCSQNIIIEDGKILLGSNQGVFFWEFDGPRERKIFLKIIGSTVEKL
jgi:secondary thiamine-phosphate synthase enzyme